MIAERMGGGGMGTLHKAIQINLDKAVALKFVNQFETTYRLVLVR